MNKGMKEYSKFIFSMQTLRNTCSSTSTRASAHASFSIGSSTNTRASARTSTSTVAGTNTTVATSTSSSAIIKVGTNSIVYTTTC